MSPDNSRDINIISPGMIQAVSSKKQDKKDNQETQQRQKAQNKNIESMKHIIKKHKRLNGEVFKAE